MTNFFLRFKILSLSLALLLLLPGVKSEGNSAQSCQEFVNKCKLKPDNCVQVLKDENLSAFAANDTCSKVSQAEKGEQKCNALSLLVKPRGVCQ